MGFPRLTLPWRWRRGVRFLYAAAAFAFVRLWSGCSWERNLTRIRVHRRVPSLVVAACFKGESLDLPPLWEEEERLGLSASLSVFRGESDMLLESSLRSATMSSQNRCQLPNRWRPPKVMDLASLIRELWPAKCEWLGYAADPLGDGQEQFPLSPRCWELKFPLVSEKLERRVCLFLVDFGSPDSPRSLVHCWLPC